MGPQAQALSQPAVVRSDLSGVISESFKGILFFLEALWPGRTSFPFSLENKKKPCRLGRRGSQIPGLFLDYIINCVPFLMVSETASVLTEAPWEAASEQVLIPLGRTVVGPKIFSGFPAHQQSYAWSWLWAWNPVIVKRSSLNPALSWFGEKPLNHTQHLHLFQVVPESCEHVGKGRKIMQCLPNPADVKTALELYKYSLEIELLERQIEKAKKYTAESPQ